MPRYIAFYKPYGVLSQFTGEKDQRTLAEFSLPEKVYAAGRLDKDSEGLLLLSDDGPFIKKLLDPENGHERVYWAEVEGVPDKSALAELAGGVVFKGYRSKPCLVSRITPQPDVVPRDPPVRFRKAIPTCWASCSTVWTSCSTCSGSLSTRRASRATPLRSSFEPAGDAGSISV